MTYCLGIMTHEGLVLASDSRTNAGSDDVSVYPKMHKFVQPGERVFVLRMLQARDPALVGRPFFAHFDPRAKWLTDLEPAFADRFPFEPDPFGHDAAALPGLWPDELVEPAAN